MAEEAAAVIGTLMDSYWFPFLSSATAITVPSDELASSTGEVGGDEALSQERLGQLHAHDAVRDGDERHGAHW